MFRHRDPVARRTERGRGRKREFQRRCISADQHSDPGPGQVAQPAFPSFRGVRQVCTGQCCDRPCQMQHIFSLRQTVLGSRQDQIKSSQRGPGAAEMNKLCAGLILDPPCDRHAPPPDGQHDIRPRRAKTGARCIRQKPQCCAAPVKRCPSWQGRAPDQIFLDMGPPKSFRERPKLYVVAMPMARQDPHKRCALPVLRCRCAVAFP